MKTMQGNGLEPVYGLPRMFVGPDDMRSVTDPRAVEVRLPDWIGDDRRAAQAYLEGLARGVKINAKS